MSILFDNYLIMPVRSNYADVLYTLLVRSRSLSSRLLRRLATSKSSYMYNCGCEARPHSYVMHHYHHSSLHAYRGIWTRDIKVSSSIPQQSLTKALKLLEQRMLIKSIRSVVSKSKKLYVLFDVEPAKEITGGPWYSDQEFDHEFVAALGEYIYRVVEAQSMVDLDTIAKEIKRSGICKVLLSSAIISLSYSYIISNLHSSAMLCDSSIA